MKKYHPINGELVEVPEMKEPRHDDYYSPVTHPIGGRTFMQRQYEDDMSEFNLHIASLPRYPMSEGLKKWVGENKKEYYTEDDFKLRYEYKVDDVWEEIENGESGYYHLYDHVGNRDRLRIVAVPIEETIK